MFPSRWLLVFFVLVANTYAKVHKCSHDHIHSNIDIKKQFIDYKHHPFEYNTNEEFRSRRRELDTNEISESEPEPQPIRIKPYYDPYMISTENGLTESQIEYIKSLISTVIRYYESFVSVIPVSDKLSFDRTCTYWIETEFGINCLEYLEPNQCGMVDLPNQHMNENYLYFHPSNTTRAIKLPSGSGIPDTDLVIYVSYAETASCGPSTLAWAQPCEQDQFGRPISGNVNICPYMFQAQHFWKQDVVILLHEINHIMIMSPPLWKDFRDPINGNIIPEHEVISSQQLDGYIYITSPSVTKFAQNHFDCDKLIGWPLEDTGNSGSAGAHWDERFTMSALMGSTIWGGLHFFSGLTFALMNDSGWYYIDYDYVEPYYWGKNAGCDLFDLPCIDSNDGSSNWPQYFCTSPRDNGCSYNYVAPGYCEYYFTDDELPEASQYFSDSRHGGPAAADYCPFRDPNSPIPGFEGACHDINGNEYVSPTFDAEIHGINSRCVDIEETFDDGIYYNGYCFKHTCFGYDIDNKEWEGVMIHIAESEVINCTINEQPNGASMVQKYSSTQNVRVSCPNIEAICGSTSNPFACFYGNWNDNLNKCICNAGYRGERCDIEDKELSSEIVLDEIDIISTSTPVTSHSDTLCLENFSNHIINGEYVYDGLWNFYPIWRNEENGLFVHWNIFAHWWIIHNYIDTFYYHSYCNISEWTSNIMDCNGHWRVYVPNIDDTIKEESAMVYYGKCNELGSQTTNIPTTTTDTKHTRNTINTMNTINKISTTKDDISFPDFSIMNTSQVTKITELTEVYPSESPTYPITISGKLGLMMDEYSLMFIAVTIILVIIVIFFVICCLICRCKMVGNYSSYSNVDETRQSESGGGQRNVDEESTEYQYVET